MFLRISWCPKLMLVIRTKQLPTVCVAEIGSVNQLRCSEALFHKIAPTDIVLLVEDSEETKMLFISFCAVHFPVWVTKAGHRAYFWKEELRYFGESSALCADIPDGQTIVVPSPSF